MLLPGPLTTSAGTLRDALGRRVILRGANLSGRHKTPPFRSVTDAASLDRWPAQGWNVLRLVVPWEAVQPARDTIDHVYLEHLVWLARAAGQRGVHVVLDLHQDLYARALGGSGAPAWSMLPEDVPGEPPAPDRYWFLRYATSEAVRRSLARLWTNADGIQAALLDAVAALARALGPEPAVLGIEPWNEPFPGDRPFDTFEADDLAPYYQRVIGRARAHAPHWLAFVEGTVLASEQGTALELPGVDGLVYSPHFYDKVVMTSRQFDGELRELHAAFATFARDAARLQAPWLLGEFGVSRQTVGREAYLEAHRDALRAAGASATAWHYSPDGHDDWNEEDMALDDALLRALAEPYPSAIHGDDVACRREGDTVELTWRARGPEHPSEVRTPAGWTLHTARGASGPLDVEVTPSRLVVRAPEGPVVVRVARR